MPEEDNQQPVNDQNNSNSDLFGFLERMLTPIVAWGSKSPEIDQSNDTTDLDSELVSQLRSEIEELRAKVADGNSEESSQESSEPIVEGQDATPTFPDVGSASADTKSKRDRYLEIASQSPRKAAKYFQDNFAEILAGVRFFE